MLCPVKLTDTNDYKKGKHNTFSYNTYMDKSALSDILSMRPRACSVQGRVCKYKKYVSLI